MRGMQRRIIIGKRRVIPGTIDSVSITIWLRHLAEQDPADTTAVDAWACGRPCPWAH